MIKIIQVDRTEPRRLVLLPEARARGTREMKSILQTIEGANAGGGGGSSGPGAASTSSASSHSQGKGLTKVLSAYGIAGFVRFLEGYYIIFIVRRLKCAMVGFHSIYKIEETKTVYVPNSESRQAHQDEARYAKMFASVDLTTNFYYSYSYDLTNTLQHNLATPKLVLDKGQLDL